MEEYVDSVSTWQDQHPPPSRRPVSRRWLLIGGIALALALALGLGALFGSQIGTTQAAGVASGVSNSSQVGGAGFGPGAPGGFQAGEQTLASHPGGQGQCVMLTVSTVTGSTVTAKAANGSSVTIHLTASTKYTHNDQSVSASAITVGSHISVMGTHNSDGSITATSIDIA